MVCLDVGWLVSDGLFVCIIILAACLVCGPLITFAPLVVVVFRLFCCIYRLVLRFRVFHLTVNTFFVNGCQCLCRKCCPRVILGRARWTLSLVVVVYNVRTLLGFGVHISCLFVPK